MKLRRLFFLLSIFVGAMSFARADALVNGVACNDLCHRWLSWRLDATKPPAPAATVPDETAPISPAVKSQLPPNRRFHVGAAKRPIPATRRTRFAATPPREEAQRTIVAVQRPSPVTGPRVSGGFPAGIRLEAPPQAVTAPAASGREMQAWERAALSVFQSEVVPLPTGRVRRPAR